MIGTDLSESFRCTVPCAAAVSDGSQHCPRCGEESSPDRGTGTAPALCSKCARADGPFSLECDGAVLEGARTLAILASGTAGAAESDQGSTASEELNKALLTGARAPPQHCVASGLVLTGLLALNVVGLC